MQISDINHIINRIKKLLLTPEPEWQKIRQEKIAGSRLFCFFIIYPSAIVSICTFLLRLLYGSIGVAVSWGIINFIASVAGSYICFRLTREYLSNKIQDADTISLKLSIYSSVIFIVFHSFSIGFADNFAGDLTAILSLLSLRTLYTGLNTISLLNDRYRKSAVIIIGLLVICTPIIITRLLTIIFRIPVINT